MGTKREFFMATDKTVTAIRAALERDGGINLHEYPIRIISGETIRLEGDVANIEAKRKARMIATRVAGDTPVEDHLRLIPGERREGKALLNSVLSAMMQEPAFSQMDISNGERREVSSAQGHIQVKVDGNRVVLLGWVNSLSHRRLAEVLAWWVPGCCDVLNLLHVEPHELETDDEISDAVRLVFDKEPSLSSDEINVLTRNAEVTLHGVVHSHEQKRIATYDCWYIPGVHAVHNELEVRPR
jgi:osmotically-inducible protein OsmY